MQQRLPPVETRQRRETVSGQSKRVTIGRRTSGIIDRLAYTTRCHGNVLSDYWKLTLVARLCFAVRVGGGGGGGKGGGFFVF